MWPTTAAIGLVCAKAAASAAIAKIILLFLHRQKICGVAHQRWSPRGHILKSLALVSKVKSLASRPHVLENWPVLGSRTALVFELLKFRGALEKCFGKRVFVEIA